MTKTKLLLAAALGASIISTAHAGDAKPNYFGGGVTVHELRLNNGTNIRDPAALLYVLVPILISTSQPRLV